MNRPNLLFIHSDQHCFNISGCYGDEIVQTPHLDSLARSGIAFDNAYCPSPLCVPSRMSMLTGRHPYELEVWNNFHVLNSGLPTFAHSMGAAGYSPVLFGRMHSIGPDQLHGYSERYIGDHIANFPGNPLPDRGVLGPGSASKYISLELSGKGQSGYQVHDEEVTRETISYLNNLGLQKRQGTLDRPFSVSVGFMLPHAPYVAHPEDYELYEGRVGLPRKKAPVGKSQHPHYKEWKAHTGIDSEIPEKMQIRARTAYWALITRMDCMVGEILKALKDNQLDKNTIIVYSSDHGEQAGERGLWWKQTFYDESAKVPLIMSWPGRLPENERCDRVVSALDLNATLLDALQAPPLPMSRGRSLLPLLSKKNSRWDDLAYSEFCGHEKDFVQRMVRKEEWKLIYFLGHRCQLFNLKEDPEELHDLGEDPHYQNIQDELKHLVLEDWDPDQIFQKLQGKKEELELLRAWAKETNPAETYRWQSKGEMNYLIQ
ncbi:MAG: sulfatase-like hydrolase/transferase [SAR324 cluster bacterium]|nr:sulfatase-like hydrolase/transferase [SAR324 cluster bacterium]